MMISITGIVCLLFFISELVKMRKDSLYHNADIKALTILAALLSIGLIVLGFF